MKVALVSVIYNHGKILAEIGTPLLLAFEEMKEVEKVDVYTQIGDERSAFAQNKAKIIPVINPAKSLTYIKLLGVITKQKYDRIVVNSFPTSQGNKNIANLLYLSLPIIWSKIYGLKVSVLYHNSPFLNEVEKLGYSGLKNKIKSSVIKAIEREMYSSCDVFFLLKLYAERIREIIPYGRASQINLRGIVGFTTLFLNRKLDLQAIKKIVSGKEVTILAYGTWGPQKDLSKALEALKMAKNSGLNVRVVVAGDVNLHFPDYAGVFEETLAKYQEVIDNKIGFVSEVDLYSLFTSSDIIILPYVVSGGFSGVLSISMLFGLDIIVPEFKEFKEQVADYGRVHFVSKNFSATDIASKIEDILRKNNLEERRAIEPAIRFMEFIDEIKNSHILG